MNCSVCLFLTASRCVSQALAQRLLGDQPIWFPPWVNRLADVGRPFVPDSLYHWALRHVQPPPMPSDDDGDDEDDADPPPIPDDLRGLSTRELRTLMFLHNIDWEQCVEKEDMIAAVEAHRSLTGC